MTRAFRLAWVATTVLVIASIGLRLANPFSAPDADASDYVPHLWAIAALVVVALAHSWAPTLAWVALVVGSTAATLAAVGLVREMRAAGVGEPDLLLLTLVLVALMIPPAVAGAYAASDGHRSRAVLVFVWASVTGLTAALALAFLARTLGGDRGGVPEWAWLVVVGSLLALGLVRDLRPAVTRTRARTRPAAGEGGGGPSGGGLPSGGGALSVARIFVDELVPGREAGRAEAAEDERGRLAADLHAEVLPSLRRALAEAEAGGTVERLALDLRSAVDEVEALLAARRSIVLEELGLLAAVEWIAERIEDRSEVRVEIEVGAGDAGGAGGDGAGDGAAGGASDGAGAGGRPPRDVERAAFRVAQLALDNVVRHAPRATARVAVAATSAAVRLRIEDDGDGAPVDEASALRGGRRGIADMRAEARSCGAALAIGAGSSGHGTAVELRWPG